jgi:hypothetical protein
MMVAGFMNKNLSGGNGNDLRCDAFEPGLDVPGDKSWPELAFESRSVVVCLYTGKEDGPAYEN